MSVSVSLQQVEEGSTLPRPVLVSMSARQLVNFFAEVLTAGWLKARRPKGSSLMRSAVVDEELVLVGDRALLPEKP